jgi:hypothetical protein
VILIPNVTANLQKQLFSRAVGKLTQHGGGDDADNLALACPDCNLRKGPNLTGIDPETGAVVRLFHPRRDVGSESSSRTFRGSRRPS